MFLFGKTSSAWILILLVSECLSYDRDSIQLYRNQKQHIQPLFREDCTDERCDNEVDFYEDLWSESDLSKRNRLDALTSSYDSLMALTASAPATAPISWNFPNSATSQTPSSSSLRSTFQDAKIPLCSCEVQIRRIELGSLHYPRYLIARECINTNCRYPPYGCKEIKLKVSVLKQKEEGDKEDRHAPLLPEPLRGSYMFKLIPLTVGCECAIE